MRFVAIITATVLVSTPALAQAGDAALGRKQFAVCGTCHGAQPAAAKKLGPNLAGVVGRRAASQADYKTYSVPMKKSGIVWTRAQLDAFLAAPAKVVPGTRMTAGAIRDAGQRANIIAYLEATKP